MAGVVSLVYVSAALRSFTPEELAALLERSRQNNVRDGITGMLLHHDRSFMQAIEGPSSAIDDLMGRLRADRRHSRMIELLRQTQSVRDFPDWSMACFHAGDLPASVRDSAVDFFGDAYRPELRGPNASRARLLLGSFRDSLAS